MLAPIEQTFTAQPIAPAMPVIGTPQYFPQPNLPANNYFPPQPEIISSGQIVEPTTWNLIGPIVSPTIDSSVTSEGMTGEAEKIETENVQEGQIEGEIISSDDKDPKSEMTPKATDEPVDNEATPSDPEKSESMNEQGERRQPFRCYKRKTMSAQEEAEKAAAEKAAEDGSSQEARSRRS